MAVAVAAGRVLEKISRRGREHRFFCGMSILIALVVFIGFSRTYFLAAVFHARPLPAPIVHIHGAVFTSWIGLLVIQTALAGSGRTGMHRRLGVLGLILAPTVVVLGVLVANEMLRRTWGIPGFDGRAIYAVALSQVMGFALPVAFAFRLRGKPEFHKRLVLVGTIAMTTAAFGRWPLHFLLHKPLPAMMAAFGLLFLLAIYDLLAIRGLHRATALGGAWVVLIELTAAGLGDTSAWRGFAAHVHSLISS